MITLPQLREYMRKQLQEERNMKSVRVNSESIEDALKQASIELACPVKKLAYEIIQGGSRGMIALV